LKQWIEASDVDMVESGTWWLSTHDIKIMIWIVFFSLSFFNTIHDGYEHMLETTFVLKIIFWTCTMGRVCKIVVFLPHYIMCYCGITIHVAMLLSF
jgi:hypothetical protein